MKSSQLLSDEEAKKIELGEVLEKDYFYIPVIYYEDYDPDHFTYWHSLRFSLKEPPESILAYASNVPAGKTLWQAVRDDLENDFNYPHEKSFVIEQAKPFDVAKTKDGKVLTRVLVWVSVYEKFDASDIRPLGTSPFWFEEGEHEFNLVAYKYFN